MMSGPRKRKQFSAAFKTKVSTFMLIGWCSHCIKGWTRVCDTAIGNDHIKAFLELFWNECSVLTKNAFYLIVENEGVDQGRITAHAEST